MKLPVEKLYAPVSVVTRTRIYWKCLDIYFPRSAQARKKKPVNKHRARVFTLLTIFNLRHKPTRLFHLATYIETSLSSDN